AVKAPAAPVGAWRVIVVGSMLARRLERPLLRDRLGRRPLPVQVFETLDEAMAALEAGGVPAAEAVLLQCATLRAAELPRLQALAQGSGARRVHVLYGFATSALSAAFESAGLLLLRSPQDDRSLAAWLQASCSPLPLPLVVSPRRWDDAALADFAGLSSTIACECPRHVAELLMQLSSFEAYSAECAHRDPADAALHAYLGQVAGTARALFEQALERLAVQEGLMLPGEGV
ncbi:MerR family transcriptional regulator, partial [Azohydromonas lata]|nr:MerR family transcriptional regulator [Azohydromonas lata]